MEFLQLATAYTPKRIFAKTYVKRRRSAASAQRCSFPGPDDDLIFKSLKYI